MTLQLNISRYAGSDVSPIPLLYVSCANFGRDTATTDFIPLVSYATPDARRESMLPGVFLSDDSGGGNQLGDDIVSYLHAAQTLLSDDDKKEIKAFACELIHHMFDPDLPGVSTRLLLGYSAL